jgi:hypothetical protein
MCVSKVQREKKMDDAKNEEKVEEKDEEKGGYEYERCPYNQGDWPSLFIGDPSFVKSPLHRDTFGSSFFSLQLAGTKTWRVYPFVDAALLCPVDPVHFTVSDVLGRHGSNVASECPLLEHARYVDIDVGPGDLLYVPSGSPHQVLSSKHSDGMTIMIGMNVVQVTDVPKVLEATRPKRLLSSRERRREKIGNVEEEEGRYFTTTKYEHLFRFFSQRHGDVFPTTAWDKMLDNACDGHVSFRAFEKRYINKKMKLVLRTM